MTRQQLIEDNMRLVYHIVHRHYPTYATDEDIIQTGMVGLCKAADSWDAQKGEFSTLAGKCIHNEILNEFRRRKKHQGILSLDYEVDCGDGEKTTFGDFCVGDEDVQYANIEYATDQLSTRENEIITLKRSGLNICEIGKKLGVSKQYVWKVVRKLKTLIEQSNRN
jgi:RNA polymerase sporulation-specific sigma factor